MKIELTGQTALVTGAARGIGAAIAERFAASGAHVVLADVDAAALTATASRIPNSTAVIMDVTDETRVESVIGQLSRLDIAVNNAGVNTLTHRVTVDSFPAEEWQRIIDVDLNGVYLVSRAAARKMAAQGSGRIINIASVAGLVPLRLQCAFTAAKAGVINLTRAMALELAPKGILVNAVAPGSILTEGTRRLFYDSDGVFADSASRLLSHVPLGRPGTPEEVALAVLFLADPENSYVTGHCLTVDGGWTAGYLREF